MSRAQTSRPPRRQRSRSWLPLAVGAVVLLAAVGAGVLLLRQPASDAQLAAGPASALPSSGRTLGNPNAPVTVDEWGDFQ